VHIQKIPIAKCGQKIGTFQTSTPLLLFWLNSYEQFLKSPTENNLARFKSGFGQHQVIKI